MTFGERIVYFREKKNMSQKALADEIGITANRLYYYEKDKRQPDVETIKAISAALGVTGDDLLGTAWANKKPPAPEGTEDEEQGISELEDELRSVLLKHGILTSGDITREQSEFLKHIFALILAFFKD